MAKNIANMVGEIFHDGHKRIERNQLKPGQHIFVYRAVGSYTHHGIYVGKGQDNVQYVIHFLSDLEWHLRIKNSLGSLFDDAPCKVCGYKKKKTDGGIVKTCLDCFMKKWDPLVGTNIYLYDYSKTATYQLEEMVRRAHQRLKNKKDFGKYNLVSRTDEDFAKDCTTDSKPFGVGVTVKLPGFNHSWTIWQLK